MANQEVNSGKANISMKQKHRSYCYIYYCFKVALVLLIIVFGQKSFESLFHNQNIPYGGILAALTWGIAHFFTKGSSTGIRIMVSALAYGCVYLLVNRDIRKTYPIIWLMFVL